MQSTPVTLEEIMARHDWISTFTHPPDVASLLLTNDAPSPLQSARLKTTLQGLKTTLVEIQSDLELLYNVAASVEARVSRLQSLKQDYETALSPVRRIPSEIAMEILRLSWKDVELKGISGRRPSGINVFTISEGPWHLGQVCSSWRNVIETLCPELWASMTVARPSRAKSKAFLKPDTAVEIVSVVLDRSRNHPLDFHFDDHGLYWKVEDGKTQVAERCFYIMVAYSKRWRAVKMTLNGSLLSRLSLIRGKTNLLRDVCLKCCRNPPSRDIRAFEIAPKLENLHLKGMHPEASICFPITNLVSFSDARPFAGDRLTFKYLDIVKSAPKLLSFSYNDYEYAPISTPFSTPRVISTSVEKLSTASPTFMRSLVLPSLEDLTLTTEWDLGIREPDNVSLVAQLGEVNLVDGSPQHSMVPSLQTIGVRLNALRYTHVVFLNSAFVDMVASRLCRPSNVPHLMKLQLSVMGRGWSYALDEAALNKLKDEGLELELDFRLGGVRL
ncbi:hypothetical protein ARMGADRAFT_1069364 [Armillaria gallica]|uniref:F-box domain-containing protein n=1 Tax=Armillaria gallica TaxID=47427 RepID=A0A2H3CK66_ARMGA|nr:hypothetical protein ARMGADRAFT_1069364 [Armillaria gallica]